MYIIDGKLVKCLAWRDGEQVADKKKELQEAGYAFVQTAPAMGKEPVHFDYYLPREMVQGDLIAIPLGTKRVLMIENGYLSRQIFNGKETIGYIDWLLECIEMFDKAQGPSTLVIPVLPDSGKMWVVEV